MNSLGDILTSFRMVAAVIAICFSIVASLRLWQQYHKFRYTQSIYLLIFLLSGMADELLRTISLILYPSIAQAITVSQLFFLAAQVIDAAGVTLLSLYLIGIVNGFWTHPIGHGQNDSPDSH